MTSAAARQREDLLQRRLTDARAFGAASEELSKSAPHLSARKGLWLWQRLFALLVIGGYGTWLVLDFGTAGAAFILGVSSVFAAIIALRFVAAFQASRQQVRKRAPRLADHELWDITILVPLLREADVLPDLVAALCALDYPTSKLDVKLLIEADDLGTMNAAMAMHLPGHFEIIPVPPGEPRTKPKALNYGLQLSTGRIIVVFDAEDRPSPDQPRAAVAAFIRGPSDLAVVQAPLAIDNGRASWLSRQFQIEYAIHFLVWLPMLARSKWPIALGGTSNYFRRDRLEKAGKWDPWNVTEDADIGLRLARFGWSATTIEPPTYEEAPHTLGAWLKQRTRWIKGHLQTWIVLNRRPFTAVGQLGLGRFLATQLTFGGGLLASMLHLPLVLYVAIDLLVLQTFQWWHFGFLTLGYLSAVTAAMAAGVLQGRPGSLLLLPLYWPLQSLAMCLAIWEMETRPHFWAKTSHAPRRGFEPNTVTRDLPDNVIQLELPFAAAPDAATHQLAARN